MGQGGPVAGCFCARAPPRRIASFHAVPPYAREDGTARRRRFRGRAFNTHSRVWSLMWHMPRFGCRWRPWPAPAPTLWRACIACWWTSCPPGPSTTRRRTWWVVVGGVHGRWPPVCGGCPWKMSTSLWGVSVMGVCGGCPPVYGGCPWKVSTSLWGVSVVGGVHRAPQCPGVRHVGWAWRTRTSAVAAAPATLPGSAWLRPSAAHHAPLRRCRRPGRCRSCLG